MKRIERVIDAGDQYGTPVVAEYDDEAAGEFRYHVTSDFNDLWFRYDWGNQWWSFLPDGPGTTVDREYTLSDERWFDPETDEPTDEQFPVTLKRVLDELRDIKLA